jgi:putative membrane protein
MRTLIHLGVLTAVVLIASRFIAGVRVKSTPAAVLVAAVFGVANWLLGGVLSTLLHIIVFLPAILTLGLLFLVVPFVVNAILLWITDKVLHVFEIENGKALALMSGLVTVALFVLHRWV